MDNPYYLPMQFFYKGWGGQPYQRIERLNKVGDLFVEMVIEGQAEETWGVAERLVARDILDGTACFGVERIAQYLQDMGASGFQLVEPHALVKSDWRCPTCGERRYDFLVWDEDEFVVCQICDTAYIPR